MAKMAKNWLKWPKMAKRAKNWLKLAKNLLYNRPKHPDEFVALEDNPILDIFHCDIQLSMYQPERKNNYVFYTAYIS